MCGIAGLLDARLAGCDDQLLQNAKAMGDAIAHRGPDAEGFWIDAAAGVAFAHRRLSIIDLSAAGAQPMLSSEGRFVICYNGEVYNAEDIRRLPELSGIAWRGHSDTEVIVESCAKRGIERTIDDLNGMFAIALWDRSSRTLHLIRDRLGIKPLFAALSDSRIAFASELKSFQALPDFKLTIDPRSVTSFLRYGYVPAPFSIFRELEKVKPGEHVIIAADKTVSRRIYWSAAQTAAEGLANPNDVSDSEAIRQLTELLGDAVSRQMLADVPLGAFLSGGIDSSTVAALMVRAKRGPVRTFSIGFPELGFDESKDAAAVARHLGTDHTGWVVTAQDALNVVPRLAEMYDEPFADSSQIPTHLVSSLTRNRVTVALSGDGGDELFAGYYRYRLAEGLWQKLSMMPVGLRRGAAGAMNAIPMSWIDQAANVAPRAFFPPQPADKLRKFADIIALDEEGIYRRLVSQCADPSMFSAASEQDPASDLRDFPGSSSFLDRMQLLDTATYLPDDIMQKVDRASMAVALEARPPLLDHRVVEFAWRLPRRFKIRNGETKWLLRRVVEQFIPRDLLDRPKMGFGIPLADWLRGPLRDWAEDLLDPERFGGGFIQVGPARRLWAEHLSGRRNWAYALWTMLMFEVWRRRWAAT